MENEKLKRGNFKSLPMDRWSEEAKKRGLTVADMVRKAVEKYIKSKPKLK